MRRICWRLCRKRSRAVIPPLALFSLASLGVRGLAGEPEERGAEEVFRRRILPIFESPDPSSCVQCHLAGVDLKSYLLPSHEKTFRSLRDQGAAAPRRGHPPCEEGPGPFPQHM